MSPIVAALQGLATVLVQVAAEWLVSFFKKHVLSQNHGLQAMAPDALRALARQWVKDMLSEFGSALVAKGVIPGWAQGIMLSVESLVAQAIEQALDAAGL